MESEVNPSFPEVEEARRLSLLVTEPDVVVSGADSELEPARLPSPLKTVETVAVAWGTFLSEFVRLLAPLVVGPAIVASRPEVDIFRSESAICFRR